MCAFMVKEVLPLFLKKGGLWGATLCTPQPWVLKLLKLQLSRWENLHVLFKFMDKPLHKVKLTSTQYFAKLTTLHVKFKVSFNLVFLLFVSQAGKKNTK